MIKQILILTAILACILAGTSNSLAYGISKYDLTFSDPLVNAADQENIDEIVRLLKNGYSINSQDEFGTTALMRAAYRGNAPLVKALLEKGADVHQRDMGGASALHIASRMGQRKIVALLMEYGASTDTADALGYSAAGRAIKSGKPEIVKTILKDKQASKIATEEKKKLSKLAEASDNPEIKNIVAEIVPVGIGDEPYDISSAIDPLNGSSNPYMNSNPEEEKVVKKPLTEAVTSRDLRIITREKKKQSRPSADVAKEDSTDGVIAQRILIPDDAQHEETLHRDIINTDQTNDNHIATKAVEEKSQKSLLSIFFGESEIAKEREDLPDEKIINEKALEPIPESWENVKASINDSLNANLNNAQTSDKSFQDHIGYESEDDKNLDAVKNNNVEGVQSPYKAETVKDLREALKNKKTQNSINREAISDEKAVSKPLRALYKSSTNPKVAEKTSHNNVSVSEAIELEADDENGISNSLTGDENAK